MGFIYSKNIAHSYDVNYFKAKLIEVPLGILPFEDKNDHKKIIFEHS